MVVGKPLATRTEPSTAKPQRAMKGVPLNTGFNRLMPQGGGGNDPAALTPKDMTAGGAVSAMQAKAMGTLTQLTGGPETPIGAKGTASGQVPAPALQASNPLLNTAIQHPKRANKAATSETAVRVAANRHKRPSSRAKKEALAEGAEQISSASTGRVGSLSARFESGNEGVSAVGYDRHGGTSYGKYQLSSRAGSVKRFIQFLKKEEPDWANRLEKSGPANTGSKKGKMPETWKKIAAESPQRFEDLQNRFIHQSHFMPAVKAVSEKTGLSMDGLPDAFKEVVFSTAVQHGAGGAARIVSRALSSVNQSKLDPDSNTPEAIAKAGEAFIRKIYAIRHQQFGSSSSQVQAAVKNRLNQEMNLALGMLRQEKAA